MADDFQELVRYFHVPIDSAVPSWTNAEEAALAQIDRRVGAQPNLSAVLACLADALRPVSPCDRYSLAFVDHTGQRLVAHETRADYTPVLLNPGYAEDLAGSSLEELLRHGRPRVINDLAQYAALHPASRSTKLLVREGVRSNLTCPLRVDERVVGVLFRSARLPNAYHERHVRLQMAAIERISQVVEKTYRVAALTEAQQAYFEMLGFVVHELKSPLAGIQSQVALLREGYLGPLTPQQQERLDVVTKQAQHLMALTGDYLQLARIERGELTLTPAADLDFRRDLLEPALEMVTAQAELKHMTIQTAVAEDLPLVELDEQLVRVVLVNLLGNAVKYGREGGVVRVTAGKAETGLRVVVWNEGPGFPPEQRARLFKRFSRLQTPELRKRAGSGIGLYTMWRIVRLHSGRVDARSEPGAWAEFSFEIPQPLPDYNSPA